MSLLWIISELYIIYIFVFIVSQNFMKIYEDIKGIVIGNHEVRKWYKKKVFCKRCLQLLFLCCFQIWIHRFNPIPCGSKEFQRNLFTKLTKSIVVAGMKERNDSSGDDDSDDDTDDPSLQSPQSPTEVCPSFSSFIP